MRREEHCVGRMAMGMEVQGGRAAQEKMIGQG